MTDCVRGGGGVHCGFIISLINTIDYIPVYEVNNIIIIIIVIDILINR